MVRNIIKDSGKIDFRAKSKDSNGDIQIRAVHFVCWVIDDNTLVPIPIVYPELERGETLIHQLKD